VRTVVRVTLNPEEVVIATQIGMQKTNNSISGGLQTSYARGKGFDMYFTDINGYGAELAFCKIFNLFPDLTSHNRVGGYDAVLHDGTTVDVKQSKSLTTALRVKVGRKKLGDSALYALLVGELPTYTFIGFATEEAVFKSTNITKIYDKDHYTIPQENLLSVKQLLDYGIKIIRGEMVTQDEHERNDPR
jgi:hypothetical protein